MNIWVVTPKGLCPDRLMRAAARAGACAIVPLGADVAQDMTRIFAAGADRFAVSVETPKQITDLSKSLPDDEPGHLHALVARVDVLSKRAKVVKDLRAAGVSVLAEVDQWSDACVKIEGAVDGFLLKGHECGGLVSEQTAFILLQQFARRTELPLHVRGGITPETAAAARVGGAAGVVLDDQILLLAESPLEDEALLKRLSNFSGNETLQVEAPDGGAYLRGLDAPRGTAADDIATRLRKAPGKIDQIAQEFSWAGGVAPAGQGLALADSLAKRYRTLGKFIQAIHKAVATLPAAAAERAAFAKGAPLADHFGIDYPIIQGPMTRVSDVSDFFGRVAEGGALPMAALALLRQDTVAKLLDDTHALLGDRPWGVGMLGFADTKVLKPQMEEVLRVRPKFAIIAGGRINQVKTFEDAGIQTFVHTSTAGIVRNYLDEGARRFVVEGRECGGHIGPMSSFVLWSAIIDAVKNHPVAQKHAKKIQIVFAGGVHDETSAAMVATLAEPLAAMGIRIGVLMGTAYLFTKEIVDSGAIVPDYQQVALDCDETQSLWEGPGFASRCAITPINAEFRKTKLAMEKDGKSVPEVRNALEHISLGALRMATKGKARTGPDGTLTDIDEKQRYRDGMYMIGQVAAMRDEVDTIAALHDRVSDGSVARLGDYVDAQDAAGPFNAPAPCDVAIVGISTLLPGSDTLQRYWRRILSGESAISEIPADRWSVPDNFDEDKATRDRVYSKWGGFLDDVAFNPIDYGTPPNVIKSVDTCQLLTLELVKDALEDATGGATEELDKSNASIIFGFSGGVGELGSYYVARSELPRLLGDVPDAILDGMPEWTEDSFAGLLPNVSVGRVANRFDFGGTNNVVDAACASSLTAIYNGVMELESRRADMVVAGGLDSLMSPFGYLCFSKTTALSPRGICNTFDTAADGIVISEGLAAVVLKRLEDAERDGDKIYAVIKGVGASSDGRAKGLTAPLPAGQKRALGRAYAQAGFTPADVDLFEAHGTGTVAGDKAELETITDLVRKAGGQPHSAAVGSIKTLIGHTKAAAGVAGLVKVALGLHAKTLPPHAFVKEPNARFLEEDMPLYLSQSPRPWVAKADRPRRAGVSAFGFGGTNFHVALEEYRGPDADVAAIELGEDILPFALAAADRDALAKRLDKLAGAAQTAKSLTALAAHPAAATGEGDVRVGFTTGSLEEAQQAIAAAQTAVRDPAAPLAKGLHFTDSPALRAEGAKLAFLFSGQGSQYPDMARQTALLDPVFMDRLDRAETVAAATPTFQGLNRRLSHLIWPGDAFNRDDKKRQMAQVTQTQVAQPALGAIESGMFALLSKLGARPDMVAGHSYGEFAALHAAGALSFEDLIRISEARGRAMVENGDPDKPGAMAAVKADAAATSAAIDGMEGVWVANLNSPTQTVIAGDVASIEKAIVALEGKGLDVARVPVSQAFHSPLMHAARDQFLGELKTLDWAAATLPVYANETGEPHDAKPGKMPETMARHMVSGVDFVSVVSNMARDGATVFVEVGPKSVLSNRVGEILGDGVAQSIALDRSSGDAKSFLDGLVQMFVAGCDLDIGALTTRMADPRPRDRREDEGAAIWYLNGAYARRADEPKRDPRKPGSTLPALAAPTALAAPQTAIPAGAGAPTPSISSSFTEPTPATTEVLEFMSIPPETPPGAVMGAGMPSAGQTNILGDYHNMMREFLRVQERVMMAYMGQAPAASDMPAIPAAAPMMPAPMMPAPVAAPIPAPVAAPAPAPAPAPVAAPVEVAAPAPAPAPAPEPAPAAAEPAGEMDLMAMFISIIADKTGYPEDAQDPDQDLEADLGIDSIKRMEILGEFRKSLPADAAEAMQAEMDTVAELPTIREIVDFVGAKMTGGGAVNGGAGEARPFDLTGEAVPSPAAVLPRYIQMPFAESADHVSDALPQGMTVLVTEAADGFHKAVSTAVEAAGGTALLVPDTVLADGATLTAWAEGALQSGQPHGLIYLGARAAMPPLADLDGAGWDALHRAGTKRAFAVLQALAPYLRDGGRIIAAMETGGLFGRTSTPMQNGVSAAAGVIGLLKALSLEWEDCSSKIIDLDPGEDAAKRAGHLVHELSFVKGRREAGYPGGVRTILRTEPASLAPPEAPVAINGDWVVVATGGAKGITAECLRTLAPYKPTLVLVGRSPLPQPEDAATQGMDVTALRAHFFAEAKAKGEKPRPADIGRAIDRLMGNRDLLQNVTDFTEMGAKVDYRALDVGDSDAVHSLFSDLYKTYGRIDMIVHGAGLIEDTFLEKKTPESFDRVFDTKVNAAYHMIDAVEGDSLKAICFFTSVAGRYGNRGQTDYAAANETLNRLAWQLKRDMGDVTVKAINWGPWGQTTTGAGMVTDQVRAQFESRGVYMVEAEPGRDLFFKEMFWADPDQVESIGWVADGEFFETQRTDFAKPKGKETLGGDFVLLRDGFRRENGRREVILPLDIVSAPYVDHHRFDGKGVLPMMGAVQMMSEVPRALGAARPVVAMENIRLFKGITLDDLTQPVHLEMTDETDARAKITMRASDDPNRISYSAEAVFGDTLPAARFDPAAETPAAAWTGVDIHEMYRSWLSHGPRFQVMDEMMSLTEQGVWARAHGTKPGDFVASETPLTWNFDPGLMDGILQANWIWSLQNKDMVVLPMSCKALRRYDGNPDNGPLLMHMRVISPPDDHKVVLNGRVFDATGALCYEMQEFALQASDRLNRIRGGWQGGARPSPQSAADKKEQS